MSYQGTLLNIKPYNYVNKQGVTKSGVSVLLYRPSTDPDYDGHGVVIMSFFEQGVAAFERGLGLVKQAQGLFLRPVVLEVSCIRRGQQTFEHPLSISAAS